MVSHAQANQQTLVKLLVVAVAMFGFGYAMVPFYRAICDALGLNSVVKADAVANTQVDASR
jgi:cytochrome c oxidase assembly protein subunit 11